MFRFKKFSIEDNRCAHKVGTDGTLLGAWANVANARCLLDIGCGSGLIALMLAQRTAADTHIDAVELSLPDYSQACENVKHSPWSRKISVFHSSIQQFESLVSYDCIVANPPFFNKSFKPPAENRIAPRHTETLSHEDLLIHALRLLTPSGALSVVLPYTEGLQFIDQARERSLHVSRQWSFRTRAEKPIERWLLEFTRTPVSSHQQHELLLYERDDNWSDDYRALTREFYLKA